jgi:hypothetical protein
VYEFTPKLNPSESGKRYEVVFDGKAPLQSGDAVISASKVGTRQLRVVNWFPVKRRLKPSRAAGAEQVLLVSVQMPQLAPVCSATVLAGLMWNSPSNAAAFWSNMSYGSVTFARDSDQDGRDDVASVVLDNVPTYCAQIFPMVSEKLALQGVNAELWKRVVMVVPSDYSQCGWAQASIGCDYGCQAILTACDDYPDSLTHELGHTLGLRHGAGYSLPDPSKVDDYEDRTTVMVRTRYVFHVSF